jgi:hypothetical protein
MAVSLISEASSSGGLPPSSLARIAGVFISVGFFISFLKVLTIRGD